MSPEAATICRQWWEEKTRFTPGVTSGVLADMLEEQETVGVGPEDLDFLRGHRVTVRDEFRVGLCDVARVWPVSLGSTGNPVIRHLLYHVRDDLTRDYNIKAETRYRVCVGPEDADRIARSREFREWIMRSPYIMHEWHHEHVVAPADRNPLTSFGLPSTIYGWPWVLDRQLPPGILRFRDCPATPYSWPLPDKNVDIY